MPSNLNTSLDLYQKVHFIGIGGIGISALARILYQLGDQVSGSDQSKSNNTISLEKEGINVYYSHAKENLDKDCQLVIHTIAIPEDNPELLAAKEQKCQILTYPQALGLLTEKLFTIAISGTHGKTTTTAMTGLTMLENETDPSIIVGSLIPQLDNKNERVGHSKYLVVEACEYQESFLNYHPDILV
ncbi:UDP-N-acetylmuramate--L-alanine ligase, partial [Candidatus Peregrinibacteria bacterium]|nr:UDP-N-acetylmuramate--L-alanine ligase [Candidatus Peregrinibacteria bacterium]